MRNGIRGFQLSLSFMVCAAVLMISSCAAGESTQPQLRTITVGVMPIVDTAAIYLGNQEGFFAEEGLELELQAGQGGASIIPGVEAGYFDFGFSNYLSVMSAHQSGSKLQFVANGASTTGDHTADFSAVVVREDSPIDTMAELQGATVAVNNLDNIGQIIITTLAEEAGADPAAITFTEVSFPDAPAAVADGTVDAAWIVEPFLSVAQSDGARVLAYNHVEFDENMDIGGFFTTTALTESEPELVAAFTRAMNKSLEYANANPGQAREVVGSYTRIDEDVRATMVMPRFKAEFNVEGIQKMADQAHEYGVLAQEIDVTTVLP